MSPNPLLSDDLIAIQEQTAAFVQAEVRPHGETWEDKGEVPREVLRQMGELGMFGLRVPEEHGGLGLGHLASVAFSEALGSSTFGGFDATVLVHTDMASPHLLNAGTPDQLSEHLPTILTGEKIWAIGVTEPDAGSDVAGMRTSAVRDGDGWRINGTKIFITNGVYGDVVVVAARTDPDSRYGISMFIVDQGTEGFSVGRKLNKHGWLCSDTAELIFDDVWVDDSRRLGAEHRGFYEIMKNFQNERLVLIGMGVGAAQEALTMTVDYVKERPAFGGRLFELGAIRQRLAMGQAKLDAVRASMYHAAWLADHGDTNDAVRAVSGIKAFGAEAINEVLYDCVQFHGGMGYMRETAVERIERDARLLPIGGGATEVMLEEVAKRV